MNKALTKQILLSNNYWALNKDMVKLLGLEAAFLLSNFAEAENMMSDKEGWFYQTSSSVEKMTTLSRHKQNQAIKTLIDLGILEQENKGMPMKRYFRINYDRVATLVAENSQTSLRKTSKQDCQKSATSKESSYKESNYKESTVVAVAECNPGDKNESKNKKEKTTTAATDINIKDIAIAFEQNGFGTISGYVRDELSALVDEYPPEWILDAIKEAVECNVRNLKYTKAILRRWKAEGKDTNKEVSRNGTSNNKFKRNTTKINGSTEDIAERAGVTSL